MVLNFSFLRNYKLVEGKKRKEKKGCTRGLFILVERIPLLVSRNKSFHGFFWIETH